MENLHELLHIIGDEVTNQRFRVFNTWFNEGFCDYFSGRLPALKVAVAADTQKASFDEILDTPDNERILYRYAPLLIEAIGKTYHPENPDKGVMQFTARLYGDGTPMDQDLGQVARNILESDEKTMLYQTNSGLQPSFFGIYPSNPLLQSVS